MCKNTVDNVKIVSMELNGYRELRQKMNRINYKIKGTPKCGIKNEKRICWCCRN